MTWLQLKDVDGRNKSGHDPATAPSARSWRTLPLHAHRNAHAAADAERGKAFLGVALLHLVQQRHQHARAGGADRMAERDRATVDVDLRRVPAEVLVDRASLR